MNDKLLIILGPTATGKTNLAINIAKKFDGEIVSCDSRQVYRGMDIGTGKDLPEKKVIGNQFIKIKSKSAEFDLQPYLINNIPVWLYDVVNPDDDFSLSLYRGIAEAVIIDIQRRGKLPIIVGGTGLYILALTDKFDLIDIPRNLRLRTVLNGKSLDELQKILCREDTGIWNKMNESDRRNPRRLIRKIEIVKFRKNHSQKIQFNNLNYNFLKIGLTSKYPYLYSRIDKRVDERLDQGIISEIRALIQKGYTFDLPSMSALGYKEWKDYIKTSSDNPQPSMETIIEKWKYHEHAYARRQMTWFRKMKDILWFDICDGSFENSVVEQVNSWYTKFNEKN